MTNLQSLSIFLTERLMLAAQEIFKAVEVTVTEYHDEISRSRQENELLKSRLLEAGIQFYPVSELQPGLSVFHGEPCVGSERGDPGEKIQVKKETSASREELRVPLPQTNVPEEPVSPSACLENEQRIEEMLHPQMTDSSPSLQAHQCMQIKEETDESKSSLGAEIFCTSQSSMSDDPSSGLASNQASGLETELDILSSMHNASELPLTSRVKAGQPKRCVNYNPTEQDKVLQRRENHSLTQRILDEDRGQLLHKPRQIHCVRHWPCSTVDSPLQSPDKNQCKLCGKIFRRVSDVRIHERVHSGERPYHCPFCGNKFKQQGHLRTHVRIHTGEKPFICPKCGRRFKDPSVKNKHVKRCKVYSV
ncbi:zinc finger protein 214 isoform X4 [Tachysurus vachellii]|uniref:zinc finger protein 214 isoform X4 n=1 Tax=Tachysurus vachellii TaxID=175792 RepID=UPI00296A9DA7|nr:zinc finger protein 214 isoform X4 [Tachysurus vachellii]